LKPAPVEAEAFAKIAFQAHGAGRRQQGEETDREKGRKYFHASEDSAFKLEPCSSAKPSNA
jgi:hypothetical protein